MAEPMRDAGAWRASLIEALEDDATTTSPAPLRSISRQVIRGCARVMVDDDPAEFPSARSSDQSPDAVDVGGCRPVGRLVNVGDVVRLRTARASCMRWRSPLDDEDARSRGQVGQARLHESDPSARPISSTMTRAIGLFGTGRGRWTLTVQLPGG